MGSWFELSNDMLYVRWTYISQYCKFGLPCFSNVVQWPIQMVDEISQHLNCSNSIGRIRRYFQLRCCFWPMRLPLSTSIHSIVLSMWCTCSGRLPHPVPTSAISCRDEWLLGGNNYNRDLQQEMKIAVCASVRWSGHHFISSNLIIS